MLCVRSLAFAHILCIFHSWIVTELTHFSCILYSAEHTAWTVDSIELRIRIEYVLASARLWHMCCVEIKKMRSVRWTDPEVFYAKCIYTWSGARLLTTAHLKANCRCRRHKSQMPMSEIIFIHFWWRYKSYTRFSWGWLIVRAWMNVSQSSEIVFFFLLFCCVSMLYALVPWIGDYYV